MWVYILSISCRPVFFLVFEVDGSNFFVSSRQSKVLEICQSQTMTKSQGELTSVLSSAGMKIQSKE